MALVDELLAADAAQPPQNKMEALLRANPGLDQELIEARARGFEITRIRAGLVERYGKDVVPTAKTVGEWLRDNHVAQ